MEELHKFLGNIIFHQSFLIKGRRNDIIENIEKFFTEQLNFNVIGNPDYHKIDSENIGIVDVRNIIQVNNMTALGGRKFFVLSGANITTEAQNALLKIVEEPSAGALFFLILEKGVTVLSTLSSRLQLINFFDDDDANEKKAISFLKKTPAERIAYVSKIAGEYSREETCLFLTSLTSAIHKSPGIPKSKKYASLSEISRMIDYSRDTSSSVKMILEHTAIFV